MGLKYRDLEDVVLSKMSIDEFEPKTGESKDIVVVGFRVLDQTPGRDLYTFINNSAFSDKVRDVETSPNPDAEGNYYVFFEIDRNEQSMEVIRTIVNDVEHVAGELRWKASTHLTDDYHPLFDKEIEKYFISDPELYTTRDEWEAGADLEHEVEDEALEESVAKFFESSDVHRVFARDNVLELNRSGTNAKFNICGFGEARPILEELGIADKPIKSLNMNMRKLNVLLGEMKAVPIDNYIVIYHPADEGKVMVVTQC